ncbi:MAG: prepilin-type N-terminal cleavage/methylation domain-containing protein [Bacteroidota bacterium]|nr:prepilin-type N-terminal cleavage/methylation domain-containing protein [Bacteroidota bacterium]
MCPEKRKKNAGFTLVELIVVVAILGFLLSIAVPRYLTARALAAQAATKANLHQLASSMELYMTENPTETQYPGNPTNWLKSYIPKAPIPPAGGTNRYQYKVLQKVTQNDSYAFWDPSPYNGKYFAAGPGGVIGEGGSLKAAVEEATGIVNPDLSGSVSLNW